MRQYCEGSQDIMFAIYLQDISGLHLATFIDDEEVCTCYPNDKRHTGFIMVDDDGKIQVT